MNDQKAQPSKAAKVSPVPISKEEEEVLMVVAAVPAAEANAKTFLRTRVLPRVSTWRLRSWCHPEIEIVVSLVLPLACSGEGFAFTMLWHCAPRSAARETAAATEELDRAAGWAHQRLARTCRKTQKPPTRPVSVRRVGSTRSGVPGPEWLYVGGKSPIAVRAHHEPE